MNLWYVSLEMNTWLLLFLNSDTDQEKEHDFESGRLRVERSVKADNKSISEG